jgi:hypothetical protein
MGRMAGGEDVAHVLAIAVGPGDERGFVVVVEEDLPGTALPIRAEGRLVIDLAALRGCSTPRAYGMALGEALLTGPVLTAWTRARARGRERLHVVLAIDVPELRTLRWERLCAPLGEGWDFVRCDQRTPFTLRTASESDRVYAAEGEAPRVLLLVTSPTDLGDYGLAAFDTLATLQGVREAVTPWACDVLAFGVPEAVGRPTLEGLCAQLTARRYAAVHVVCHGAVVASSGESVLYLADEEEGCAATPGSKLLRRLGRLGGDVGLPLLWFLGACASAAPEAEGALGGLAVRLCRELGAPAVVAMSDRISIDTANALAGPFYRQLRAHGLVDLALAEACSQVAERADLVVPVLHARAAGSRLFHGTGLLGHVQEDRPVAAPVLFSAGPLPLSLGGRFVGRAAVLAELTRRQTAAGSRPVGLALVAAGGQGKTRVALELMWQQRGLYPGGVFWLDVSAPGRLAAAQHALLMQLRPETPALAVLQAGGVDVAVSLAAAARGHMPGQAQLWVLDHLPEPEAGQGLPTMAELCPRWGEVAVIVTSRILPGDPELEVMELGPLTDEAGAALLTAGLPAGAMAEAEARAVSAWVGGLPIALELLARSLDLGDLSLAELATQVRGAGVAQALAETQQVLHAAGAAVGMSPIVESLRISYARLSPEAQGLARRLAQFGPEPLPTAMVKALGQHASRLARATLAGRSFVTGISGESFGVMHRVLADFLRGLCGAEEPAEACAALLAALPAELLGEPRKFERLLRIVVHAEALLARGTPLGRPGLELGLRVGQLYCNMQRPREAEPILRRVVAQAQASLPADDRVRLVAESNLALALGSLGLVGEARALQEANVRAWEARGADDPEGLTARANLALTLQLLGDVAGAYAEHTKVAQLCELRFGAAHPRTLDAWSALAHAELQRGDAAAAIGLQERALLGLRRLGAAGQASVLKASGSLAQMQQLQGNLPAARATIEATLAEARGLWSAGEPAVLHMQAAYAAILRDLGDVAGARAEFTAVRAGLERALGLADPQTLAVVLGLAQMAQQAGQYAEARALLAEVVARGRPRLGLVHPVLSLALTMLIDVALQQGEVAWALTQLQQAVAELRGLWPSTRPELLGLEQRLGDVLGLVGDPAGARVLLTNVLARWEGGAGPRHPGTIAAAASLGLALQRGGALAEARAVQERVLRDSREVFGATAVDTWTAQRQLASTLHMLGEFAEARALLAEVVAGLTQRMGESHPEVLLVRGELGTMALWMGSTAAAEAELVPAIAGLATQLPADHQVLFDLRTTELRLRIAQGRLAEARGLLATLWAQVQGKHGPVSVVAAEFAKNAGDTLLTVGAAAEAALWLRVGLELLMQLQPAERVTLDCAMATATAMVQARGEPARARELLTRASEQVRQRLGAAHPWVAELAAHAAKLGLLPS